MIARFMMNLNFPARMAVLLQIAFSTTAAFMNQKVAVSDAEALEQDFIQSIAAEKAIPPITTVANAPLVTVKPAARTATSVAETKTAINRHNRR